MSGWNREAIEKVFELPDVPIASPGSEWWKVGTRVRKVRGSSWQGHVVGFYQTSLTPRGYAIESEREPGSVQIYPEAALELLNT